ncbi:MAG TPA: hypothetical protein VFJ16_12235 [Longimicrobium sp.]|nr:hypothetical protein [Longimicrobium sp.]
MRLETSRTPTSLRLNLGLRRTRPRGDTEYLLANPEMAARLRQAREDLAAGRTHELTLDEFYGRYGRESEA